MREIDVHDAMTLVLSLISRRHHRYRLHPRRSPDHALKDYSRQMCHYEGPVDLYGYLEQTACNRFAN